MKIARLWRELRKPPLWQAGRLLFAVSRDQAFLDRASWILSWAPQTRRRRWALWLLSLSPHYFIYQWADLYRGKFRAEVLAAEHARNAASRRAICDGLLRPYLQKHLTALDFGCGPGYLAREVCQHVRQVMAVDISRGVLACAQELNGAPNIQYIANHNPDLKIIEDASIDLLYSIAVIQHLERTMTRQFLSEFARVLKPGAVGICHFVLGAESPERPRWRLWFTLRMTYYTAQEIEEMARDAGFSRVCIVPVRRLADIADDVGRQHVALLEK